MITNADLEKAGLTQEEMCAFWEEKTLVSAKAKVAVFEAKK